MQKIVTNKITDNSTIDLFEQLASHASKIVIAVAFFSDSTIIKQLLNSGKHIDLIVSLRPPTNYYSLKEILHKGNIEISFLGDDFHSKIFGFFNDEGQIISLMVGSSNFTNGGFSNNIETNVVTTDKDLLNQMQNTLVQLSKISTKLQPDTLSQYKKRYDLFQKYKEKDKNPIRIKNKPSKQKISKKASEYLEFWKVANKIKNIVGDISKQEYPKVPEYLVIDHFWHWVVRICDPKRFKILKTNKIKREKNIVKFFTEYCKWDKSSSNSYTEKMGKDSAKIRVLLTPKNLLKLSSQNALSIFRSFHATQIPIQRFGADEQFIKENKIIDIRKSFKHLLDDTLLIEVRIHDLINPNSKYKLKHFGPSCVQELIGWANPKTMPIRNNKADNAVKILGFRE